MEESKVPNVIKHLKLLRYNYIRDNRWNKTYDDCSISVDLDQGKIIYPQNEIFVHDETTSNFKDESLVVLECVDRLLTKGYPANKIELEIKWPVGLRESGKLDIGVKCQENDDIYLMIECKTNSTYDKELTNMEENDGGQLFSYFQQNQSTNFLCLYTSWCEKNELRNKYSVIPVEKYFRDASTVESMFEKWNKQFFNHGIFEFDILPYKVRF